MKVKELLKRFRNSSNCEVFVQHCKSSNIIQLNRYEILNLEGVSMDMKVNSFEIINNILTIYVS